MKMYVRTYGFYEDRRNVSYVPWTNTDGRMFRRLESLSESICFPNHAVCHHRYSLGKVRDSARIVEECAKFTKEYLEPCIVILSDGKNDYGLTQSVRTNVFASWPREREFFILFNARPEKDLYNLDHILNIGYDRYSIAYDPNSIIVWDAEHYLDDLGDKYELWGIYNNTGKFISFTDDVLARRTGKGLVTAL